MLIARRNVNLDSIGFDSDLNKRLLIYLFVTTELTHRGSNNNNPHYVSANLSRISV